LFQSILDLILLGCVWEFEGEGRTRGGNGGGREDLLSSYLEDIDSEKKGT